MSEKKREVNAFGKRNPFTSIIKGNIGIIAVLIIMCVIVSIATDKFLTTNNIISVLRQISINTYIGWFNCCDVGNPYGWTYCKSGNATYSSNNYWIGSRNSCWIYQWIYSISF